MTTVLPCTAIVPTRDRYEALKKMLYSLSQQSAQPLEMIIVDASTDQKTKQLTEEQIPDLATNIVYCKATNVGAAAQRNQGFAHASQELVLFMDDDITFEPACVERLWRALLIQPTLGGVSAMIINQKYLTPGRASHLLFRVLHGQTEPSFAGKCIGPALNLLPEDRTDLPEVVFVEWLNLGCTLYRRHALPQPPFLPLFKGYSMMEDLALSLTVGMKWQLANARTARIFHDSQSGIHKQDAAELAKMELINRHYIMTHVLDRRQMIDYLKLCILELFGIVTTLTTWKNWSKLPLVLKGKFLATAILLSSTMGQSGNVAGES